MSTEALWAGAQNRVHFTIQIHPNPWGFAYGYNKLDTPLTPY
jgi:hypothetical protein